MRHQQVHGAQTFTCDQCDGYFKTVRSLSEHILNVHSTKSCACDICSKTFSCKSYLKQHLKTHNSQKTHVCEYCLKSYSTASRKKRHYVRCRILKKPLKKSRVKKIKKPVGCDYQSCLKVFSQQKYLNAHMKEHFETYYCNVCNKSFASSRSLKRHLMNIHDCLLYTSDAADE